MASHANANATNGDEVSTVLRHFRPRPEFASSNSDHERMPRSGSGGPRQRQKRRRFDRGFSSVQFVAPSTSTSGYNAINNLGGKIRLAYLHAIHQNGDAKNSNSNSSRPIICVFLTFEIGVDDRLVECVQCNAPNEYLSTMMKSTLDRRCKELSSDPQAAAESLFSITSRLLQLLNNNEVGLPIPTSTALNNNINAASAVQSATKGESFDGLIHRIASSKVQSASSSRTSAISQIHCLLDLQTLLMRCAAAGRNRSKICTPVPVEFAHSASATINKDGDALSRLVFNATNQLYMHGFGGNEIVERQQQTQSNHSSEDLSGGTAWTLLSFLLTLPWTTESALTREKTPPSKPPANKDGNNAHDDVSTKNKSKSNKIVRKLILNLQTAPGDPSPTFAQNATEHGTTRAYHGTKIESAWSILNHGLRNLSYNASLGQNGAMMGEGVYLSSSERVAEGFAMRAAERPPTTLAFAFQHESLLRLLFSCCCADDLDNVDIMDVGSLDCPLDGYDIVCLPVFEAMIIKPPSVSLPDNDGGHQHQNDKEKNGSGNIGNKHNKGITRQEGKYFVCSDSELVRITKLHLTIELTKKSNVWQHLLLTRMPLTLVVLVVAMLWAIMG